MRTLADPAGQALRRRQAAPGDELLASGTRRALAEAMVTDVLTALRRATAIDAIARRHRRVAARGARPRLRRDASLDDADDAGQSPRPRDRRSSCALSDGFDRVLLVPGDCPALDPDELDALLTARATRATGGRDRPRPPRHRHQRAAALAARRRSSRASARAAASATCGSRAAAGRAAPRSRRSPSLALDVDTADDLAALRDARSPSRGAAARAHTRGARSAASPRARRRAPELRGTSSALAGLPRGPRPGDDLARADRRRARPATCAAGDVLVVAHKVVSKAEGALRAPGRRRAGRARARARRGRSGKDPRQVQVVLDETRGGRCAPSAAC